MKAGTSYDGLTGDDSQPELLNGLQSLRDMTDAEASVVVLAAAAQHVSRHQSVSTRHSEDITLDSSASNADEESLQREIDKRWVHSSRHRLIIMISFGALVIAWLGVAAVAGLVGYVLYSSVSDVNVYAIFIGGLFVGVATPLTL